MAQLLIFTPGVVKQLGSGFAGEVVAVRRASPRVIPSNFVAGAAAGPAVSLDSVVQETLSLPDLPCWQAFSRELTPVACGSKMSSQIVRILLLAEIKHVEKTPP